MERYRWTALLLLVLALTAGTAKAAGINAATQQITITATQPADSDGPGLRSVVLEPVLDAFIHDLFTSLRTALGQTPFASGLDNALTFWETLLTDRLNAKLTE